MTMNFSIVLWKPQLIFTGVSIMRINPETRKFCSHIVSLKMLLSLQTPWDHGEEVVESSLSFIICLL